MYLVGHAQYCLLAYHRSDQRLTIGPKQEDENGNRNKERVLASGKHNGDTVEKVESRKDEKGKSGKNGTRSKIKQEREERGDCRHKENGS